MTPVVNPGLLQLAALGIEDDHYLHDGRHLRWSFSPDLGFPRTGFRLHRRPAPLPWSAKREDVNVRRAPLSMNDVEDGVLRHSEGFEVTTDGQLSAGNDGGQSSGIAVGSDTVSVRFTEDGSRMAESTPACWVLVRYSHHPDGNVAASGVYVDGDEVRVQDRGASGQRLVDSLDRVVDRIDRELITEVRGVERLPTSTDRFLEASQLNQRLEETTFTDESSGSDEESSSGGGIGPFTNVSSRFDNGLGFGSGFGSGFGIPPIPPFGTQWESGTFLLNGTVIDEVHLTGRDAQIEGIEWITVEDYARADGWQSVDTFHLPLDGDGVYYPSQGKPGKQIARERLDHAPPKALGPWANSQWPPSPASDAELQQDRQSRYLDSHDELTTALKTLFETELTEGKPQRAVRYGGDEDLEPSDDTNDDLSGSSMSVPLLGMLQAASVDPGMATMLGLKTVDLQAQSKHVDYMLSADWWDLWVWGVVAPSARDTALDSFRERNSDEHDRVLPIPWLDESTNRNLAAMPRPNHRTVVSVATDVTVASRDDIDEPGGLDATVETRTAAADVPAITDLEWDAPDSNLYTDDGHVAYAVRRVHGTDDDSLARTDPDSSVPLPHMPATDDEHNTFADRSPPLGDVTYRVSGMDVWGRWSDFAETDVTVTDDVPPPAPTGLEAELVGDGSPWDLEVSFDWTAGQQSLAPHTVEFEIHCERGKVDRDFSGWNGCETGPSTRHPVTVSWPGVGVTTALSDVRATLQPAEAASDEVDGRVTVKIPDVVAPYDADHRAEVSTTVVAVDDNDNRSPTARRTVAERVAPVEPSPETLTLEPQTATWPDAEGLCYWTAEWSSQPKGSKTRVLRAPQARLLSAGDESLDTFEGRDTTGRVQRLRELAVDNQSAFAPDHDEPYDESETRHQVALPADDRGWSVVAVRHTGPTGTRAPWPSSKDCFAVVRTPPTANPPTPNLGASGAVGEVHLSVTPDQSGTTEEVRLYRTPDRSATDDVRRMRPLPPERASETTPIEVQDSVPPDRWYAYRAVAVGPSGKRSEPTDPMWVRATTNQPPSSPTVESVVQPQSGVTAREVTVRVEGYGLDLRLHRRRVGTDRWERLDGVAVAEQNPNQPSPGTFVVTLTDQVPASATDTRYTYRAEVIDRRGASTLSQSETQQ